MTSRDVFSVLSNMTGTTPSKWLHLLCTYPADNVRVRKKVRERHPEFLVAEDSWPRFLYDTGYRYDPNNIEKGLFKSTLLLKVIVSPRISGDVCWM